MKRKIALIAILSLLGGSSRLSFIALAGSAYATPSSASYKISTAVIDAGAAKASSASYRSLGKARAIKLSVPSSTSYKLGEGFLRSAYFAAQVLAPIVTAIAPSSGPNTDLLNITDLSGANFASGATVKLVRSGQADIVATNVVLKSSSKLTCTFDLTGAAVGLWDVVVVNQDGRSGSLPSAFQVTQPSPIATAINPSSGLNTETVDAAITGSYFKGGASAKLVKSGESDIVGENVLVPSSNRINCRFNLVGKAVGQWDLVVTNPDGQSATLSQAFKLEAPDVAVVGPVINTPNPFDPAKGPTTIKYTLTKDVTVSLYLYNMRAERIWDYTAPAGSEGGKAGINQVVWEGLTAFKSYASSGVYILHVLATVNGETKILAKTKIAIIK